MAQSVQQHELPHDFVEMAHIEGIGKLNLKFATGQTAADVKDFFANMSRMGSLGAPAHFPEHVARTIGVHKHRVLGTDKLADCMAVWTPVEHEDGTMRKVCLGFVHSSDINQTTPNTAAPCSFWRAQYRDHQDRMEVCETQEDMERDNVLPITKDMFCHQIIDHLREYAATTAGLYDHEEEASDVESSSDEEPNTTSAHLTTYDDDESGDSDEDAAPDAVADTSAGIALREDAPPVAADTPEAHGADDAASMGSLSSESSFSDGDGYEAEHLASASAFINTAPVAAPAPKAVEPAASTAAAATAKTAAAATAETAETAADAADALSETSSEASGASFDVGEIESASEGGDSAWTQEHYESASTESESDEE